MTFSKFYGDHVKEKRLVPKVHGKTNSRQPEVIVALDLSRTKVRCFHCGIGICSSCAGILFLGEATSTF